MIINFAYSTPPGKNLRTKIANKIIYYCQQNRVPINLFPDRSMVDTSGWPDHAPISITNNVYSALNSRWQTNLYDWREHLLIRGSNQDVLIGHPFPNDENAVWNNSCLNGNFALRIAMTPLSHQMPEVCGRLERYIPEVDAVFGIMGPYWYDTWGNSALAHWKDKIIPIDMGIDISKFPKLKTNFNPPGKRKFFYIGWNGAQKGTHLLSILFGLAKNQKCIWIGNGEEIPNIEKWPHAVLNPEYVSNLAKECDIFITMGVSDANPTTILESMAWGFPVCCTPQSGYYNMPELYTMSITDMKHNLEMINYLQYASEDDLLDNASKARNLVAKNYTWDRFNKCIIDNITSLARNKNLQV